MWPLPHSLNQMSGLGLLWTSLSGAYIVKGIYQAVTGMGSVRDFDGEESLVRFKKRPVRRLLFGLGMNGAVCLAVYNSYCFGISDFRWLQWVMEHVSKAGSASTDELSILIGASLLFKHTLFRLHRGVYVNVFSTTVTQDALDWLAPHLYSFLAGATILAEAPTLDGSGFNWFSWSSVSWRHFAGVAAFLFVAYQDNKLQDQLAKFRKNRAGHVVSEDHKLPKGGAFEYVTSPQMLTEILIHGAIGLTLGCGHQSWWLCTGYVAISQVVRALGHQQWYKKKFESLPAGRKAVLPYLL